MELSAWISDRAIRVQQELPWNTRYASLLARLFRTRLSRRELLRLGLGVGATLPLTGSLARAATHFNLRSNGQSAQFLIEGVPAWEIDPSRFDGSPTLTTKRGDSKVLVRLSHAYYPGTRLSADLFLLARLGPEGWQARLLLPGLGFDATLSFENWLLGQQPAFARLRVDSSVYDLKAAALVLRGDAAVHFLPDWSLYISGPKIATLQSIVGSATSDAIQVGLVAPGEARLASSASWISRVQLVHAVNNISATAADLHFQPNQNATIVSVDSCRVQGGPQAIVVARVEPGDAAGKVSHGSPDGAVHFATAATAMTILQLTTPCATSVEAVATVCGSSNWVDLGACKAEFRSLSGACAVRARECNGKSEAQTLDLILARIVAPVAGADQMTFHRIGIGKARDREVCLLDFDRPSWFHLHFGWHRQVSLDEFVLRVDRGYDGLHGSFRFQDVDLVSRGDSAFLVARSTDSALVEFNPGPQHFQEEAIYESDLLPGGAPKVNPPKTSTLSPELVAKYLCPQNAPPGCPVSCTPDERRWKAVIEADPACAPYKLGEEWNKAVDAALVNYYCIQSQPVPKPTGVRSRAAEDTRMLFRLRGEGGGLGCIPLSLSSLLSWNKPPQQQGLIAGWSAGWLDQVLNARALPGDVSLEEQAKHENAPKPVTNLSAARSERTNPGTLITAPYRLGLSPISLVPWTGPSVARRTSHRRVELWHRRAEDVPLRAIWSRDYLDNKFWAGPDHWEPRNGVFRTSVSAHDRHEIVALTAVYAREALQGSRHVIPKPNDAVRGIFVPHPVSAKFMALSSYGATMRVCGEWDPPASYDATGALTVKLWTHGMQQGRDTKVVVEYKGFLFPIGHPATLVKETERLFIRDDNGGYKARLVQRFFIRVPFFVRAFRALQQPFDSRPWPFAAIAMRQWQTPTIEDPATTGLGCQGQRAFWPTLTAANGGALVDFSFEDTKRGTVMAAPLVFVDNYIAHSAERLLDVVRQYREELADNMGLSQRTRPSKLKSPSDRPEKFTARVLRGDIEFAPSLKPGQNEHKALRYALDVDIPDPRCATTTVSVGSCQAVPDKVCDPALVDKGLEECGIKDDPKLLEALWTSPQMEAELQPPFYPHIRQAIVNTGTLGAVSARRSPDARVEFDAAYLQHGFDPQENPGEVYFRVLDGDLKLDFGGNTTSGGGFASPTNVVAAMSRPRGAIGGPALMPLLVDYRYPSAGTKRVTALALYAGDKQSMDWARKDGFDPKAYFSQTLGEAKLLGVVRFADILRAVSTAAGSKAPKIVRQLSFGLPRDAIAAVAPAVRGLLDRNDGLAAQIARLENPTIKRRFQDALSGLVTALSALEGAAASGDEFALLDKIAGTAAAADQLGREVRAIADNPGVLLPADVLARLEETRRNVEALAALVRAAPEVARQVEAELRRLGGAELERLRGELDKQPALVEMKAQVDALATELTALRAEMENEAARALASVARRLEPIYRAQHQVAAWCEWLSGQQQAICREILDVVAKAVVASVDRANSLRVGADNLHGFAHDARAKLEELLASPGSSLTPQQRADIDEMGRDLATFANAVTGHARAATVTVKTYQDALAVFQSDVSRYCVTPLPRRLEAGLAGIRNALDHATAGAASLFQTIARIDKYLPKGTLESPTPVVTGFRPAIATLMSDVDKLLLDLKKALKAQVNNVFPYGDIVTAVDGLDKTLAAASKPGQPGAPQAEWLHKHVVALQGELTGLKGFFVDGDVSVLAANLGFLEQWRLLGAFGMGLSGAEQELRQAAAAVSNRLRQEAVATVGAALKVLQKLFAEVARPFTTIPDATLRQWLAPPLLAQLERFVAVLRVVNDIPTDAELSTTGAEDRIREYFEKLRLAPAMLQEIIAELSRLLSAGNIGDVVNLRKLADEVIQRIGLPTTVTIGYDWSTPVSEYPAGSDAVFVPRGDKTLTITGKAIIDLTGEKKPEFGIDAKLDRFVIRLFGGAPFLSIRFKPLLFTSGSAHEAHLTADIDGVELEEQLAFIQTLQQQLFGQSGIYVKPAADVPGVIVGFEFKRDLVQLTAFILQNVTFSIACILPFDNSPARVELKLAEPQKPFLVTAGIYGGGGFVIIRSRADTIELIEASFEYGLVTGFEFGPAMGTGRITAGIYVRLASGDATIAGFFLATGNASIAGIINLGATFRIMITYDVGSGGVTGEATFEVKFSISIVDFSYSVPVAYFRGGDAKPKSQQSQSNGAARVASFRSFANAGGTPRSSQAMAKDANANETTGKAPPRENEPKGTEDLSRCMLEEPVWRYYWTAFEETGHVLQR